MILVPKSERVCGLRRSMELTETKEEEKGSSFLGITPARQLSLEIVALFLCGGVVVGIFASCLGEGGDDGDKAGRV